MNNIKELITIASSLVGLTAAITGFLIPLVKNVKAKNRLSSVNKLFEALRAFIVEAEQFEHFSGEEKKAYVLAKASRYALEYKIPFDEELAEAELERIIEISKNVNARVLGKRETDKADKYKIGE